MTKFSLKSSRGDNGSRYLIFNTYNTHYPIVDVAAKTVGYRAVHSDPNLAGTQEMANKPEDFDVVWYD